MKDTSPANDRLYKKIILGKSDAERFQMAMEMMDDGYALVISRIRDEFPKLKGKAFRKQVLKRLYGDQFSDELIDKILNINENH